MIVELVLQLISLLWLIEPLAADPSLAKPECQEWCGSARIPYPFGIREGCYHDKWYAISCNQSFNPPKPFLHIHEVNLEVLSISLPNHEVRLNSPIEPICGNGNSTNTNFSGSPYQFSIKNKFMVKDCHNALQYNALLSTLSGDILSACTSICGNINSKSCDGINCCQTSIPAGLQNYTVKTNATVSSTTTPSCTYAFLVDREWPPDSVSNPPADKHVPVVMAWAMTNLPNDVEMGTFADYLCNRGDFNGMPTIYCHCQGNREGNAYIHGRCKAGKGIGARGKAAILGASIGGGASLLVLASYWLYYYVIMEAEQFFQDNGGPLLHQIRSELQLMPLDEGAGPQEKGQQKPSDGGADDPQQNRRQMLSDEGAEDPGADDPQQNRRQMPSDEGADDPQQNRRQMPQQNRRQMPQQNRRQMPSDEGGDDLQRNRRQMPSDDQQQKEPKIFKSKDLEIVTNNFDKSRIIDLGGQGTVDNFNENPTLNQGGPGTVYKGMLNDGRIVAFKKLKKVGESPLEKEQFIREVVILSQINHRNVVKLLGCCLDTKFPLLIFEFISNGTLFQLLHDPSEEFPLSWELRIQIATEVAGALSYLHSATRIPIYHRNIKSTNILLDDKYRAKVSDFGIVSTNQTHLTTLVQDDPFDYLDPEFFESKQSIEESQSSQSTEKSQFIKKSDVYSFGVVLVELLTGQKPISSTTSPEEKSLATHFILSLKEVRLFDILDARVKKEGGKEEIMEVANLAKRCLNLNVKERPTMEEVTVELERVRRSYMPFPSQRNFQEGERSDKIKGSPLDGASASTIGSTSASTIRSCLNYTGCFSSDV